MGLLYIIHLFLGVSSQSKNKNIFRLLMSNTFMSVVAIVNLAYYGWLNEELQSAGSNDENYKNFLALSISAYVMFMVAFMIGMVHFFFRHFAIVFGMLGFLIIGEILLFSGCFIVDTFQVEGSKFNFQLANFCAVTGMVIQGMVNSWRMKLVEE